MNSVRNILFSNLTHLLPSDLGAVAVLPCVYAYVVGKSTLMYGISNVVLDRSKPQMTWINTGSIVSTGAVVKNTKSVRNSTTVQNPTGAMSKNHVTTSTVPVDLTVPVGKCSTDPQPTRIGPIDLAEKSFWETEIKTLRFQEVWRYVFLRGIHWMLRHAPGWLQASAGALPHRNTEQGRCQ